jgi:hypothetical protein
VSTLVKPRWALAALVVASLVLGSGRGVRATSWALLAHTAQSGQISAITTPMINTTGAGFIAVTEQGLIFNASNQQINEVTDSANNGPGVFMANGLRFAGGQYGIAPLFIVSPATSTTHTFTMTGSSSNYPQMAVEAFSGQPIGCSPTTVTYQTVASTTVQPGSITPAFNGALILSGYQGGNVTLTVDSGFTITDQLAEGGGFQSSIAMAYLIQGTAAPVNPTWTASSSTNGAATLMACYPVGSGGGGGETSAVFAGGS